MGKKSDNHVHVKLVGTQKFEYRDPAGRIIEFTFDFEGM
jgi:hypothetical protein